MVSASVTNGANSSAPRRAIVIPWPPSGSMVPLAIAGVEDAGVARAEASTRTPATGVSRGRPGGCSPRVGPGPGWRRRGGWPGGRAGRAGRGAADSGSKAQRLVRPVSIRQVPPVTPGIRWRPTVPLGFRRGLGDIQVTLHAKQARAEAAACSCGPGLTDEGRMAALRGDRNPGAELEGDAASRGPSCDDSGDASFLEDRAGYPDLLDDLDPRRTRLLDEQGVEHRTPQADPRKAVRAGEFRLENSGPRCRETNALDRFIAGLLDISSQTEPIEHPQASGLRNSPQSFSRGNRAGVEQGHPGSRTGQPERERSPARPAPCDDHVKGSRVFDGHWVSWRMQNGFHDLGFRRVHVSMRRFESRRGRAGSRRSCGPSMRRRGSGCRVRGAPRP